MLTRRAILKGAAAGSIAAIASARGVAAEPAGESGIAGIGFGTLEGGAAAAFHKIPIEFIQGYDAFVKFNKAAARIFYKETADASAVNAYLKFLKFRPDLPSNGGWSPLMLIETLDGNLQGAEAGFVKIDQRSAQFFLKRPGQEPHYLTVWDDGQYGYEPPNCYPRD